MLFVNNPLGILRIVIKTPMNFNGRHIGKFKFLFERCENNTSESVCANIGIGMASYLGHLINQFRSAVFPLAQLCKTVNS